MLNWTDNKDIHRNWGQMKKEQRNIPSFFKCCGGCAAVFVAMVALFFLSLLSFESRARKVSKGNVFLKAINETNDPQKLSKYLFQEGETAKAAVEKMSNMKSAQSDFLLVSTDNMSDDAYSFVSTKIASEPLRFLSPMKRAICEKEHLGHRPWLIKEIARLNKPEGNDFLLEVLKSEDKHERKEVISIIARHGSKELFDKLTAIDAQSEAHIQLAQLLELQKKFGPKAALKVFQIRGHSAFFHKIDGVIELAKEHADMVDKLFAHLSLYEDDAINAGMAISRLRRHDEGAFDLYFSIRESSRFHAPRLDKEFYKNAQHLKTQLLEVLARPGNKERKKKLRALIGLSKTDAKDVSALFEKFILALKDDWAERALEFWVEERKEQSASLLRALIAKSYLKYKSLALLIDVGNENDFKRYKSFLKHDNFRYRILAQRAYGRFGTEKEKEQAMLLAFGDEKHQVNFAAIASQKKTKASKIRPQLMKYAKEGKHLHQRLYAAEVIGRSLEREDIPLLVKALKDRYELLTEKEMSLTVLSLGTYWLAKKFLTDSPEAGCRYARRRIASHLETITNKKFGTNVRKWEKWLEKNK